MKYDILYTKAITSVTRVVVRSVAGALIQVTDHLPEEDYVLMIGLATKGKEEEVIFCYSACMDSPFVEEIEAILIAVEACAEAAKSKREFKELLEIELDFAQYNLGDESELCVRRDDHKLAPRIVTTKIREHFGLFDQDESGSIYTVKSGVPVCDL